jgi:hypothetical protein
MSHVAALRQHLTRVLDWRDAHANFEDAVADLPPEHRGIAPPGLPYSPWQLLEHLRLAQADILAFCVRPDYHEGKWPDDYWPATPAPPDEHTWEASIAAYRRDLARLRELIAEDGCDPFARVPAGTGQTFLREFLLVADHTAYHVGQLVAVRRLLGAWDAP